MAPARGGVPERPKGTGCKPVGSAYGGSNPPAPIVFPLNLDDVLIRLGEAQTPHAYDGLAADAPWRISGVWNGVVVELHFATREEAEAFAARELGLEGRWDDPDGDGNYCIVG